MAEAAPKRVGTGYEIGFHRKVLGYMQSDAMSSIISNCGIVGLEARAGWCALTLSIVKLFFDDLRNGRRTNQPSEQGNKDGNTVVRFNARRDVNRFFGWAISRVIRKLGVDLDNAEYACRPESEIAELRKHLEAVTEMRVLHHDAILDSEYLRDCYDETYQLVNCGGLALVSRQYFGFGSRLVESITNAMSQSTMVEEGNSSLKLARKRVREAREELKALFFESFNAGNCRQALSDEEVEMLFDKLVDKTCNARFGVEIELFKEENTKRGGESASGQTLRPNLKAKCEKSLVNGEDRKTSKSGRS